MGTYDFDFTPDISKLHIWENYSGNLNTEYNQCIEEGLDIEKHKELFEKIDAMPPSKEKVLLADGLFRLVTSAKTRENYPYNEPSSLAEIKALRKKLTELPKSIDGDLHSKVSGAWYGRIAGCMLGKTVEGIRTDELVPFLKESGNYPMHRYIHSTDITDEVSQKYKFPLKHRPLADKISAMPSDDDTNYMVLYQLIVDNYGKGFSSEDVANAWMRYQPKTAYCTAERVAFCNFIKGFLPPVSAVYQNPYREWIGAQIRGDYFGYINPADTEKAADMAFRDASISHIKNGIYGEMFASTMIAAAFATKDIPTIIRAGLSEIPSTSRLFEQIMYVLEGFEKGVSKEDCFKDIHEKFDEYSAHGWCHTISNAMIVAASLLYGGGNYGKSICMAVETGFDTDCNGATVGSVLGAAFGIDAIDECWTKPFNGRLQTDIICVGTGDIEERINLTLKHIEN